VTLGGQLRRPELPATGARWCEAALPEGVGCVNAFTQLAGDDGAGWRRSAGGCRARPIVPLSQGSGVL
jgi:hypothetical protein